MKRSRIVIADDHEVVVEGLRRILDRRKFEVVGVANDGRALIQAAEKLRPDVIITDVAMPRLNGIDAAREIHGRNPNLKIIFLTMHPEVAYATATLGAGASGYVLKSAAGEELIDAIGAALNGRIYVSKSIAKSVKGAREIGLMDGRGAVDLLTHRQREILQQLAEGKQVKEIAKVLNLSPKTVEFHKYRIMHLLNLRTIADLARYAQSRGMVG
jgi:DNA-binding NarL/FixJ family response regulator